MGLHNDLAALALVVAGCIGLLALPAVLWLTGGLVGAAMVLALLLGAATWGFGYGRVSRNP